MVGIGLAVLWQKQQVAAAPGTMHVQSLTGLVAADVQIQLQTVLLLLLLLGGCCTALHFHRVLHFTEFLHQK
jgi:hypothetical protein